MRIGQDDFDNKIVDFENTMMITHKEYGLKFDSSCKNWKVYNSNIWSVHGLSVFRKILFLISVAKFVFKGGEKMK